MPRHELRDVHRHTEAWDRDALAELRSGDVDQFAETYADHDRLVTAPTAGAVRAKMIDDWWTATEAGEQALLLAHRRSDVAELNRLARARCRAAGTLGAEERLAVDRAFAVGDRILCTHNDRRHQLLNGQPGRPSRPSSTTSSTSSWTRGAPPPCPPPISTTATWTTATR